MHEDRHQRDESCSQKVTFFIQKYTSASSILHSGAYAQITVEGVRNTKAKGWIYVTEETKAQTKPKMTTRNNTSDCTCVHFDKQQNHILE